MKVKVIPIVNGAPGTFPKSLKKRLEEFEIGLVLWYINYSWLFNAKSIFIHVCSSILQNSVLYKYRFFSFKHS